jgi:MinD-like ATPase involved in chromosome partitioning or flagellar assembly
MNQDNELFDTVGINERTVEERIRDFSGLLNQIESLNDKKRKLWMEIYENAISDRQNSYAMFVRLVKIVQDKSSEHAVHGKTIATYIERMSKANEQLIKLAELIAKAERKDDEIDPDDMFERINKNR